MRKFYLIIGISLLVFLILNFNVPMAHSSDDDSDGIEDELEDKIHRKVEVEFEADKIKFESVLGVGSNPDEFEIEISNDTSLKIGLSYDKVNGSVYNELEFEIEFLQIIEFVDDDEDGKYNDSLDTIVYPIYNISSFETSIYNSEDLPGGKLHNVIINTTDGIFTAYIHILEEFGIVNGSLITPSELKIDIEIKYDFVDPDNPLALHIQTEAHHEFKEDNTTELEEYGYADDEKEIEIEENNTIAFFSWNETAFIDDVPKPVNASYDIFEDDIYLSYTNGTRIFHDPKFGIEGLFSALIQTSTTNGNDDDDDKKKAAAIPGFEIPIIITLSVLSILAISYKIMKGKRLQSLQKFS